MNDIILISLRELGGLSTTFGPVLVVYLAESRASLQVRTCVTVFLKALISPTDMEGCAARSRSSTQRLTCIKRRSEEGEETVL